MSLLERIYFFHAQVLENVFPNASDLAEEFEISTATAHRDIAYLRDRLLAPLAFDQQRNGYFYAEDGFRLPFEESDKIILFLGLLTSMGGEAGLADLPEFKKLQKKITSLILPGSPQLEHFLHCEWVETEPVDHHIFMTVVKTLLGRRQLTITYTASDRHPTTRTLDPLKLIHYQGRWYLYGWCHLRNARRLFHLSRMQKVIPLASPCQHVMDPQDAALTDVFGIFKGSPEHRVTIRFTGRAAETVAYQQWHPHQQIRKGKDELLLTLPVADDREIIMKVLQFGNHASIISPPNLRKKIHKEIEKMVQLYAADLS